MGGPTLSSLCSALEQSTFRVGEMWEPGVCTEPLTHPKPRVLTFPPLHQTGCSARVGAVGPPLTGMAPRRTDGQRGTDKPLAAMMNACGPSGCSSHSSPSHLRELVIPPKSLV